MIRETLTIIGKNSKYLKQSKSFLRQSLEKSMKTWLPVLLVVGTAILVYDTCSTIKSNFR